MMEAWTSDILAALEEHNKSMYDEGEEKKCEYELCGYQQRW